MTRLLFATLLINVACGRRGNLPARRLGVLAPSVDSVLITHTNAVCYHLPLRLQNGDLEWGMSGCHLYVGDTLFYFYVGDNRQVLAWGRAWHVPDSTRTTSLDAFERHYTQSLGPSEACPRLERMEGFSVWRAAGYFIYASADSEATKLGGPENVWAGARVGSPTCTFRDHVSPPFLR